MSEKVFADHIDKYLDLLSTRLVPGAKLKRFGNLGDGGYLMLDQFQNKSILISVGIGNDVSFDFDLMDSIGARAVLQIDHTIGNEPPRIDPRVIFIPKMMTSRESFTSVTLDEVVRKLPMDVPLILKMDIEGSEWEVLEATSVDLLSKFDQICIEFHNFHETVRNNFNSRFNVLKKLNVAFDIVHVHANNWGKFELLASRAIPDVFEVTYVNKTLLPESLSRNVSSLDYPNHPDRPDIRLSFSQFWV
jgi:hypothetical protein